jgi:hypothetical protein
VKTDLPTSFKRPKQPVTPHSLSVSSGRTIGARAQTMIFLDDAIPELFSTPLLGE